MSTPTGGNPDTPTPSGGDGNPDRLTPSGGDGLTPSSGSPDGLTPSSGSQDGLTRWQAARVARRLAGLRGSDRTVVSATLDGARDADRPYLRRALAAGHPAAAVLALAERISAHPPGWAADHLRLIDDTPGPQHRRGVRVDQVDTTTCGSAVLLAMAAGADPLAALELTAPGLDPDEVGFGSRFDGRQLLVHRQSTLFWPRALGTTPYGMNRWLARRGTGLGRYRVRWIPGRSATASRTCVAEVGRALGLGDAVPLLVGSRLPRHYVLALCHDEPDAVSAAAASSSDGAVRAGEAAGRCWRVYEPSSGEVRVVPVAAVRERRLARWLGFDRVHFALLPAD